MKKKVGRAVSYLLCLAMLLSIIAPAAAVTAGGSTEDSVSQGESAVPETTDTARAANGEYEIYPTPHKVSYNEQTITLPDTLNVVYESGIDEYTKARAVEAFAEADVTLVETGGTGSMKLRVGVKGSGGAVDTYFADHAPTTTGLYSKTDAHQVIVNADGVAVLGVNTDAAFYGLTTMKRVLSQVENKTVRTFAVEDYSDVEFRGFIEGYYGNPWSVEDRQNLMKFGGELKMNIYFYAPKDDPKHNAKWRELYTEEELENLVKPLAQAGNESKCYYGFALHAFMNERFDMNNYDADLATLKAKYEQAMTVGVRQIALLGDDAYLPIGSPDGANNGYIRILNDLTDWLKSDEMQAKYPGLKTSIPFCPGPWTRYADATGNDALLKSLAPVGTGSGQLTGNVPIIMTGGAVWGHVSNTFVSNFTNNVGVGPFYWVNWPCSDNSKGSMVFGGHDITLETGVTPGSVKGIMLNPMQQSEPSKWGIFQNADYAWNLWQDNDRSQQSGYDGFKYVDHMSAEETPASTALRELAKHMIRMNGNGNTNYQESVEFSPTLTAFQTKMLAGTATEADIAPIRAEFAKLAQAAITYQTSGNPLLLGQKDTVNGGYIDNREQMAPWLDTWVEFAQGTVDLLDALKAIVTNDDTGKNNVQIVEKYLSGQDLVSASNTHSFWYIDHYETAVVGGQYLVPFTNKLLSVVAETAKRIIDPNPVYEGQKLTGTVIRSNWPIYSGNDSSLIDGDDSTFVWYNPNGNWNSKAGEYIGLDLGSIKSVGRVRFVLGGDKTDKWNSYKLQYSVDNQSWTDVKSFTTTSANQDIMDENLGGVEARYVRVVNTADVAKGIQFSELSVWEGKPVETLYTSDTVEEASGARVTFTDNTATLTANSVTLQPGEFIGIILPETWPVEDITVTYGAGGNPGGLELETGMNKKEMTPFDSSVRSATTGARYVRLRNVSGQQVNFSLKSLTVTANIVTGITFVDATMGIDAAYPDGDARTDGNTGNWFDGDVGTSAKYCDYQRTGEYVLYDLGQVRDVRKIDVVVSSGEIEYPRHAKIQVSLDQETWVDVVTIDNDGGRSDKAAGVEGWENYPAMANYVYQTASIEPTPARYLRVIFTDDYNERFLILNEIVINDGEYVSVSNNPAFEVDPIEVQGFDPTKMTDGNLTTGFRPNMDGRTEGSVIYHVSDDTNLKQVNVIASEGSNARVSIRTGADEWHEIGVCESRMNQFQVPSQYQNVYEIKLSWGNVTPTIYEVICIARDEDVGGDQAPSEVETVPINSYSGSDCSILFDENWKFNLGDASGAQAIVYNDSGWRTVNLPHDYSIEQDYTSAGEAESGYLPGGIGWYRKSFMVSPEWENKVVTIDFGGVYMDTEVYLNGEKLGEHHYGYTPFSFVLPSDKLNYTGENVIAVKVNNPVPSSRWYSGSGIYRSVYLTVSEPVHVARYGTYVTTTNEGAVTVKTDLENSGASAAANVTVKSEIYELNSSFEPTGTAVATNTSSALSVAVGEPSQVTQNLTVSNPKLWNSWDMGTPNLYLLKTTVYVNGVQTDTHETEFGFRTINFDLDLGFQLNGENVKLKGVCMHHDQGALGSEAWYRALERQVEILMNMGCNAIRVTHNPAADELIEICNRKGVLIIDEFFDGWMKPKNGNSGDFARWFNVQLGSDNALVGRKDTETWAQFVTETVVNRDKNAPSVIMYSISNEVQEGTSGYTEEFVTAANNIIGWTQVIDRTRPLTRGANDRATDTTSYGGRINQAIHEAGGVVGFNYYSESHITSGHDNGWLMYGAETASAVNSRGIYNIKGSQALNSNKRLTSYDKSAVNWGAVASDAWWRTIRFDYNAGEFVWTGFDYIGEPTPNNGTGAGWVNGTDSPKSSFFGIIDTNGIPKDSYYLYRAMWNETDTTLHVLPTWDESDLMLSSGNAEVVVYSNAPVIRVYLNGVEVGAAKTTATTTAAGHTYRTFSAQALAAGGTNTFDAKSGHQSLYATFNIPYAAGTLEVKAFQADGTTEITETVGRDVVKTTTGASKLVAKADRNTIKNDGRDLSYITIDVTDAKGEIVNGAEPAITVSVSGDGVLMGLDNGVQPDHTSYLSSTRKAGAGRLVAIVQSTKTEGSFTVTATANGLTSASVVVSTGGVDNSQTGNVPVSYDIAKTYYVQRNVAPQLPETVTVTLANGTKETKSVTWNSYDKDQLSTVGNEFAITGIIADYNVSVSVGVVVVDRVVALLNYSTAVQVGDTPVLPANRPAVMADGSVLNAQFPVAWSMPSASAFSEEGTVAISGTAEAFGETFRVTAWVRVSRGSVIEGSNVINATSTQGEQGGFTLNGVRANAEVEKIRDGNTATSWTGSGTLAFTYDTAQNIHKVVMTFADTVPADGVTVRVGGSELTQKSVSGRTLTYTANGIASGETITVAFANEVVLAEMELIVGTPVFSTYGTAELDGMKLTGEEVPAAVLASRTIKTPAAQVLIQPVSNSNVAYTILPQVGNVILILTESEDHNSRDQYTVILNQTSTGSADDDSNDYPYNKVSVSAPSVQTPASGNEGPIEFANDGDEGTFWHSKWSEDLTGAPEKRYIQLELEEAANIVGFRYKPRPTVANGIVTKYRIEVSTDGETYTSVATGDWAHDTTWKKAEFDMVSAKYVRLYGVETKGGSGDTPNKFMSAAEVRVVLYKETGEDLSSAKVTVEPSRYAWTGNPIMPGKENVTVVLNGEIVPSEEYELTYSDNVDPGTAYVFVRPVENSTSYSGATWGSFTIYKSGASIDSIEPVTLSIKEGVAPVLPAEVQVHLTDGTVQRNSVVWDEIPASAYINPTANQFTVQGTVEGTDLKANLTVHVAFAQTVTSVTAVTLENVTPALPGTVSVQFNDGSSENRAVTWNLTSADFSKPAVVEVTGTVANIARVTAKATVRVVPAIQSDTNLALSPVTDTNKNHFAKTSIFPFAMAWHSSGNNNPYLMIDGEIHSNDGSNWTNDYPDRWSDWERNTTHDSTWMGVAFSSKNEITERSANTNVTLQNHFVDRVKVVFIDENGSSDPNSLSAVTYPASYEIEYYVGPTENLTFNTNITTGEDDQGNGRVRGWTGSPLLDDNNWKTVSYVGGKPDVEYDSSAVLEVNFETVSTAIIRVKATAQTGTHWVGMGSLEVYGMEEPELYSDFEVTSVKLDSQECKDEFVTTDGGQTYTMERVLANGQAIPQLSVEATNNAKVTIQQAENHSGKAVATITSEDGSKTVTYTVQFHPEDAKEHDITLSASGKISVSAQSAFAGATITITADPGYKLDIQKIVSLAANGEEHSVSYTVSADGRSATFTMPDEEVIITAEATPVTYSISYVLNGGSNDGQNPTSYNIETPTFHLKNPTRSGYDFTGWIRVGSTDGASMDMVVEQGTTGNLTFEATWKEQSSDPYIPAPPVTTPSDTTTKIDEDGNKIVTKTDKNTGDTVVTITTPEGVVTELTTTDGKQDAEVTLPKDIVGDVELVMDELVPGETVEEAPSITITNNSGSPVSVVIPVTGGTTVVAVRIEEDGTETIVPMSIMDENGLRLEVGSGTETYRIIDNKKEFSDVPEDHWGADAVDFVTSRGLFVGMGQPDLFAPSKIINRAMMVTVLWRLAERPEGSAEITFSDVTAGAYYRDALSWAIEAGVMEGTGNGFSPKGAVSREMLAVLLYRMAGSPAVIDEMPRRFQDANQVSSWAETAMIWAIQNNLINGRSNTRLAPREAATRVEVAAVLQRYVNMQV